MSDAPRISIITPVWNGLPYVRDCVESVLSQGFPAWEMLIGDNGSEDGTREYLDSLDDSRIRVFKHSDNLGIFGNLNFLFSQARASYSQILCADDLLCKDALHKTLDVWQRIPVESGLIRMNWQAVGKIANGDITIRSLPHFIPPRATSTAFFIFGNLLGNLSNVSVRTSLIGCVGGFREDIPYAGDFEFWVRAASSSGVHLHPTETTRIRDHPNRASVYLNRQGELTAQLNSLYSSLYQSAVRNFGDQQGRVIRALERHYFLNVAHFLWRRALRASLQGNFAFIRVLSQLDGPLARASGRRCLWLLLGSSRRIRAVYLQRLLSMPECKEVLQIE